MRDPEGRTPLFFAVAYNHAAIVEELLRAGADVHARARPCAMLRQTLPNPYSLVPIPDRLGAAACIVLRAWHAAPQPHLAWRSGLFGARPQLTPQRVRLPVHCSAQPCSAVGQLAPDLSEGVRGQLGHRASCAGGLPRRTARATRRCTLRRATRAARWRGAWSRPARTAPSRTATATRRWSWSRAMHALSCGPMGPPLDSFIRDSCLPFKCQAACASQSARGLSAHVLHACCMWVASRILMHVHDGPHNLQLKCCFLCRAAPAANLALP